MLADCLLLLLCLFYHVCMLYRRVLRTRRQVQYTNAQVILIIDSAAAVRTNANPIVPGR